MSIHKEIKFEDEVCEHLADHGYCTAVLINTDRSVLAQFGLTPKSSSG